MSFKEFLEDMLEKTKLYQELQKRKSKYQEKVDGIYKYASKEDISSVG